jgi:CRISPR-associated endoribonuclease Cas6
LTPTSFSKGDVDLPLPLPRLVFQSYLKRFNEFHDFAFLPDFVELVDLHTGIAELNRIRTDTIKTKKVTLIGFTGEVSFEISKHAPLELVCQMNLLADFAFFCGTGKKTTVGMGQTVRMKNEK